MGCQGKEKFSAEDRVAPVPKIVYREGLWGGIKLIASWKGEGGQGKRN